MTHAQWRSALGLDDNQITFKTQKEYTAWMQSQALKRFQEKQRNK